MTALVLSRCGGLFDGLGSPAAGDSARDVVRNTVRVLEELKTRAVASSVFHDLQTLARENDTEMRESGLFYVASRFLLALPSSVPAPELALDADGEVQFDWKGRGGSLLTVSLREDGRLSYAARVSQYDKEHGTKRFVDAIPKVVLELVHRVTGA